jgi:lipid A 3-O-deacylase
VVPDNAQREIISLCYMKLNLFGFSTLGQGAMSSKAIILLLLLFSAVNRSASQNYLIGVRGGASLDCDPGRFRQVEGFAGWNLPWKWNTRFDFNLLPRLESSAGVLDGGSEAGFVGTAGPVLELRRKFFPLSIEGGASPTFLSRYRFETKDLGGRFQFTDHIGLDWHFKENFDIGCRFQHMSNAGIYKHNPGLNLEMLTADYTF